MSYDCSDPEIDIDRWIPTNPCNFSVWINFTIGDGTAGDLYALRVVSPSNLGRGNDKAQHTLVQNVYSWDEILRWVNSHLVKAQHSTKGHSEYLAEFMQWEYDDYKP